MVYAIAMIGGTAVLLGLTTGHEWPALNAENGMPLTAADVTMQRSTERALTSPHPQLLAENSTARRGSPSP